MQKCFKNILYLSFIFSCFLFFSKRSEAQLLDLFADLEPKKEEVKPAPTASTPKTAASSVRGSEKEVPDIGRNFTPKDVSVSVSEPKREKPSIPDVVTKFEPPKEQPKAEEAKNKEDSSPLPTLGETSPPKDKTLSPKDLISDINPFDDKKEPAVSKTEETIQKEGNITYKTDVSSFDVAGIMLGMTVKQAVNSAKRNGYEVSSSNEFIPQFMKWRFEYDCKKQGVVGFENIEYCINEAAEKNKAKFTSKIYFINTKTKEKLAVDFTSNFTGNLVYKIAYRDLTEAYFSAHRKDSYLRNLWFKNFWVKINQKYGAPDDKNIILWSAGQGKAYLYAGTGRMLLADPRLQGKDYMEMAGSGGGYLNDFTF